MSLVLRHKPQAINATLDENGWLEIDTLINGLNARGQRVDRAFIEEVVRTNDKQRFAISEDGLRIRANQGHSVSVDVELEAVEPPEFLYHGTVAKYTDVIFKKGLQKMQRLHVHLSPDVQTATTVGLRRGFPIILRIAAKQMHADGYLFYLSQNNVWLTDCVPAQYLSKHEP